MLTPQHRKALLQAQRDSLWLKLLLVGVPVLCLVLAGGQLYLAWTLADAAGMGLGELVSLWLSGPVPEASYQGIELAAVSRIERAIGMLGLAIVLAGMTYLVLLRRHWDRQVAELLQGRGEL